MFGKVLGVVPEKRAATNGIILRHGYIVAEFGDTKTNDPVYSVGEKFPLHQPPRSQSQRG